MKQTQQHSKAYPWVVVGLLWGVGFLNYMDRQMLSTMRVPMMQDISELQQAVNFGHLMAIFLWVYGLMSPVSGLIGDRFSRKRLIVGSLCVWSSVTLLMGYATSFNQLLVLRGIMGLSEALYLPAALSLIADYHKDRTRSLAIGIHMTGLYFGQSIGGFGATLSMMYSWQTTFHWFGIIGIAYGLMLSIFLKDAPKSETEAVSSQSQPSVTQSLKKLLTNKFFLIILIYFCIPGTPGWAIKNWLPTLYANDLALSPSVAGPLSTLSIALSSLLGVILGGYISDRWAHRNIRGRIFTGVLGLGMISPALLLIGNGSSMFTIMLGTVLFGIGFGFFDANNMPILCQFVSTKYRSTAYGLMNMCGVFAGAGITSIIGKSLDSGHVTRDFNIMALTVLIAMFAVGYLLRPKTIDKQ